MSAQAGSASFLRSRFFWKLYGGALLLILLTALATALFIDRDRSLWIGFDLDRHDEARRSSRNSGGILSRR